MNQLSDIFATAFFGEVREYAGILMEKVIATYPTYQWGIVLQKKSLPKITILAAD